ncbi:MAG: ATP-binding protein [Bacteroidales bacterium]|nr:ATP-binding protein [Bacteroidales bacterium]
MKIAITSGKGGTGKTTVSTGLFHVLTKHLKYNVQLLDCDVEEPNCHIFIKASKTGSYPVTISIPQINTSKCTFCGRCKTICTFNAIIMLPTINFIEIVDDMCHGCGACSYVCNEKAIIECNREIGSITHYDYYTQDEFIEGRMHVGSALQTRVIRETINHAKPKGIILFDSPPGTSCPVIATVSKADYVIMVTEPTPFGLHDLRLMTETVKQLGKKHGIVINKAGLDYHPLYDYIQEENISLLGEIPFRKEYARAYSQGILLPEYDPKLRKTFHAIIKQVINGETV